MFAGGFKAGRSRINTVTKATNEAKRQAKEAWKSGDKEVQKNLDRIISKAKREGYGSLTTAEKALIEEAPKHILGPKMGALYSVLKAPVREGNEEMMQALASEVSGDYYKKESDYIYDSKIHPETTQQLANDIDRFWDSLKTGISNTYGNANRWEEFFIGALTGNADTATKLQTSRKIGNASFDGSSDITLDAIGGTSKAKTGTLAVASWSSNSQSLTIEGITASNNIIVSPTKASETNWNLFGVSCSAQATNSLTFTCKTTPTAAIGIQVIILP